MIKDEYYISFLKSIISCVSHGDYYSVKELSNLELEKMKQKMKDKNKQKVMWMNKYLKIAWFYVIIFIRKIVICKGGIYGNRTFAKLFT